MAEADVRKLWPTREPEPNQPGKPSLAHRVIPEWHRRLTAGEVLPPFNTAKEARSLATWYAARFPAIDGHKQLSARTIENNILIDMQKLKKGSMKAGEANQDT